MLAALLVVPNTEQDWSIWSYAHRDQHNIVRRAIQKKYNINLTEYQLDPIPFQSLMTFVDNNQQAHDDVNAILNTMSTNLQQSDLSNQAQLQAWIYLHAQEHIAWSNKLQVS